MTITVETAQLKNQSILQNFALVEELDEQVAEIISGGVDTFTVKNSTSRVIAHRLDSSWYLMRPGEERIYAVNPGPAMIEFDADSRIFGIKSQSQKLVNGGKYEFKPNAGDPKMIDLVG